MAEVQFDIKNFLSRINVNRATYIVAFLLVVALVLIYSWALNNKGKERLYELNSLKSNYDQFLEINSALSDNLEKSYVHSLLYFSEGKELYRLQSISFLNDANKSYNELFRIVQSNDTTLLPNLLLTKEHLFDFGSGLLQKLAVDVDLPETEIEPIIADADTLLQDFSEFEAVEKNTVSLEEEEGLIELIETDLFELNALFGNRYQLLARNKADSGTKNFGVLALIIVLIFLVFIFLYYQIKKNDQRNIKLSADHLNAISSGDLPEKQITGKNQFNSLVGNSNLIIDYMQDATEFANHMGEGNFEYDFKPKSKDDKLGNALIDMRDKLRQVAREDRVRNWVNEGQAKFGDILRNAGSDLEVMGDQVISNLVNYLGASMGVIYVKNENNHTTTLELLSAYALNRKKHTERELKVGEGLAGQVYQEQKPVFLKDIQTDHFNIVTGMGESKPASVLIIPLKQEDNIEGVLELASFKVFEEYQISFVEKIGESIATAMRTGKSNKVTSELLQEMQTREEEMRTQEEELKQNMEELSATQEQMERLRKEDEQKKEELSAKRNTLYSILDSMDEYVYLKDNTGKYQFVNQKFADLFAKNVQNATGYNDEELLGENVATKIKQLENKVMRSSERIEDKIEIKEEEFTISLLTIDIPHLSDKGVLGVLKK